MSNYLAVATVTATLQRELQSAVGIDVPGATATTVRPDAPGHGVPQTSTAALRQIDADLAYLDALERGDERPKLPAGRDSKRQYEIHASNLAQLS